MHLDDEMCNVRVRVSTRVIPDSSDSSDSSDTTDSTGSTDSTAEKYVSKDLDSCTFGCFASKTLLEETRVCNRELGAEASRKMGIQSSFANYADTRSQIAMPASKPSFYKGATYVDASLDAGNVYNQDFQTESDTATTATTAAFLENASGKTVQLPHTYSYIPCSPITFKDGMGCAMCLPKHMCKDDLQGLPVTADMLPIETKRMGDRIWNEVFRPIAGPEKFHDVLGHWGVLEPFDRVNKDIPTISKRRGKPVVTFSCYSTPMARELVQAEFKAFSLLADEVNRLQEQDPNSDGIYLKVRNQGTGNTQTLYMPVQEGMRVTFFHNLQVAKKNIGYTNNV
jgi:hypothetical protein